MEHFLIFYTVGIMFFSIMFSFVCFAFHFQGFFHGYLTDEDYAEFAEIIKNFKKDKNLPMLVTDGAFFHKAGLPFFEWTYCTYGGGNFIRYGINNNTKIAKALNQKYKKSK